MQQITKQQVDWNPTERLYNSMKCYPVDCNPEDCNPVDYYPEDCYPKDYYPEDCHPTDCCAE